MYSILYSLYSLESIDIKNIDIGSEDIDIGNIDIHYNI